MGFWVLMTTDVIPLGTASAIPTKTRHLSGLAIERKGRVLLFDCGEGTQYRLMQAGLSRTRVDAIFVTHLHGDHCYGLPGLLSTLSIQERRRPVTLVVPTGGRTVLEAVPGAAPDELGFPLEVVEVGGDFDGGTVFETEEYVVTAQPLDHGDLTMGFRFEERSRTGRFDVERARELGVPEGPAFGRLQAGESVSLPDGTAVDPSQVLGPERPGSSVAYVTDTRPCEGGRALAADVDLLYHDATFADDLHDRAVETRHSTAREAAEVARDAGARRLLLGHISARYSDPTPLAEEARAVFSSSEVARELRRYTLDPREKEPNTK